MKEQQRWIVPVWFCFYSLAGWGVVYAEEAADESKPVSIQEIKQGIKTQRVNDVRAALKFAIDTSEELEKHKVFSSPQESESKRTQATKWYPISRCSSSNTEYSYRAKDVKPETHFPQAAHLEQYYTARPWTWQYDYKRQTRYPTGMPSYRNIWSNTAALAESLRTVLEDTDPKMRAMAVEWLASLHQPEDVGRLGAMLSDTASACVTLGFNAKNTNSSYGVWGVWAPYLSRQSPDMTFPAYWRGWRKETVGQVARRALFLMTRQDFSTKETFDVWWARNSAGRDALWYWQQRMDRELALAGVFVQNLPQYPGERGSRHFTRKTEISDAAKVEIFKTILADLRKRSPEVEAKVRLLAHPRCAGGAPITGTEGEYWPDPPKLRLSRDRLWEILDRKKLWPDVAWDDENTNRKMYNQLAERMGMWAHVLLTVDDVPRLQKVLDKEHDDLWWSGQAGMIQGISRLLPPGTIETFDDPRTRVGYLLRAYRQEKDFFVRQYAINELARTSLRICGEYLKKNVLFVDRDGTNRIMQGVLQVLYEQPITPEKRVYLKSLLLDPRFKHYWTRRNSDMCRQYGLWAINAHAGQSDRNRNVVPQIIQNQLVYGNSEQALKELFEIINQLPSQCRLEENSRGKDFDPKESGAMPRSSSKN
jgi:hypothetical protein